MPAGEGFGESHFGRLEKKLSTLPTLWVPQSYWLVHFSFYEKNPQKCCANRLLKLFLSVHRSFSEHICVVSSVFRDRQSEKRRLDRMHCYSLTLSPTKYMYTLTTTVSVPSSELGPPPLPLTKTIVECAPRNLEGGGTHSPAGEGVKGGSQFGRLEKKPSTLSTLCITPSSQSSNFYPLVHFQSLIVIFESIPCRPELETSL